MPGGESVKVEYVQNKSWTAFNSYQGNYKSVVQINTDLPLNIADAIDIGAHECYPGHHVYNILLENKLFREKGWVELSLYPCFSSQALIAEGTASYGVALAFPENEKLAFTKNVLLPLAGLDTTGVTVYFKILKEAAKLDYRTNEAARGLLSGKMNDAMALKYLAGKDYSTQEISFIKQFRSYVINYNYGKDIVKNYIEANIGKTPTEEKRWALFKKLLSKEVLAADIQLSN